MVSRPATLELDSDSIKYLRKIRRDVGEAKFQELILKYFDRAATRAAGGVIRNYLSGQRLKRRSGSLARDVFGRGELIGGVPAIRLGVLKGPSRRYSAVQELGTKGKNPDSPFPTIRPKKAKALAVPVEDSPAVTAAGVPRYDSPRQFPRKLTFVPLHRGNLVGLLVERTKRQSIPLWLLLRSVDITPKFYLRDGMQDALPEIRAGLGKLIQKELSRA